MDSISASIMNGLTADDIIKYGVKLMIIFLVVPIHEYAHAWAAHKLGDETPVYQGRLTLNPIKHIDPLGAICLFVAGFGWGKPVEVNPLRFKWYRKGNALCAAAGPISNLIVGLIGMVIYKFTLYASWANSSEALSWVAVIFSYFTAINVGLAVFNLIPIPPLDGSKIFAYFIGPKWDGFMYRNQTAIRIAFVLLIISPVLNRPLSWIQGIMFTVMDKLTFFVDIIAKAIFGV